MSHEFLDFIQKTNVIPNIRLVGIQNNTISLSLYSSGDCYDDWDSSYYEDDHCDCDYDCDCYDCGDCDCDCYDCNDCVDWEDDGDEEYTPKTNRYEIKELLELIHKVGIDSALNAIEKDPYLQNIGWERLSPNKLTNMKVPIGIDEYKDVATLDLSCLSMLLICGCSWGEIYACINNIISNLVLVNESAATKFILIDPNQRGLEVYDALKNYLSVPVITDSYKAANVILNLANRTETICEKIIASGCKNIEEFNRQESIKLQQMTVIIEDYDCLMQRYRKEIEPAIIKLSQLGKLAGIHLILTTEKLSKDVLTSWIKINTDATICFRVNSYQESLLALGQAGAENILRHGDGIYLECDSEEMICFESNNVSREEITQVVNIAKEL